MDVQWIRRKAQGVFQLTFHAEEERLDEDIPIEDIQVALLQAEILEDYSHRKDIRGESCLVLGHNAQGKPIHIVVASVPPGVLRVVTVYMPMPPKWLNERTRRFP